MNAAGKRLLAWLGLLLLLGGGTSCTTTLYELKPGEVPAPKRPAAARRQLQEAIEQHAEGGVAIDDIGFDRKWDRMEVHVTARGISIADKDHTVFAEFKKMSYCAAHESLGFADVTNRDQPGTLFFLTTQVKEAREVAEAINLLIYEAKGGNRARREADLAAFREQARTWRDTKARAALPAEAERQRVLAEHAVGEKNYDEALEHYQAALAVAPFWADGQYNAALLAGELQAYYDAVDHIQRYLELAPDAPDAPDARAAREKLIVWEEKTR